MTNLLCSAGTVDLYDVGNRSHPKLGGIGMFDCMANPVGPRVDGQCGEMSAFSKVQAKWVEPIEITRDGEYTARVSNRFPDIFRISTGFGEGEYLLIENRGQLGYDSAMPGSGILIFHVDEAAKKQKNPGFPGQDGWPENGNHYMVALLPADGQFELEQFENNGDVGDYWKKGQSLGPSHGHAVYPNTDRYQGGVVFSTNIKLTILSDPGPEMKFRVEGLGEDVLYPVEPSPVPATQPSLSPEVGSSPSTNQPTSGADGVTIYWVPVSEPAPNPEHTDGFDSSLFMSTTLTPMNNIPTVAPTIFSKPTTKLEFSQPTVKLDVTPANRGALRSQEKSSGVRVFSGLAAWLTAICLIWV